MPRPQRSYSNARVARHGPEPRRRSTRRPSRALRAGAETRAQLDQLVQIKAAPPAAAAAPPPVATQPPRSAAAMADDLFGSSVAATTGGMAALTHQPPPSSQSTVLALPAPGGASAAELRTKALDSMRAIAARLEALAAADRADEVKWIADALQRVEEQVR